MKNKITKESIENLGFTYICGNLEEQYDLTFNVNVNGLYICLVFQPLNNQITLSSHKKDLMKTAKRIHQSNMKSIPELKKVLRVFVDNNKKIKNLLSEFRNELRSKTKVGEYEELLTAIEKEIDKL